MGNAGCISSTAIKDQNKDPKLKPFEERGLASQRSTLSLFVPSCVLWSFGLVCAALLLIARLTHSTGSIGFSVTGPGSLEESLSCLFRTSRGT